MLSHVTMNLKLQRGRHQTLCKAGRDF